MRQSPKTTRKSGFAKQMPCKIQQLGVCCLWPIKTTMASANQKNNGPGIDLEEDFDLNQSILPEPIHLVRANPLCQNQSPCPEPIHSARTNPLPAIHLARSNPFCQNQSSLPAPSALPEPIWGGGNLGSDSLGGNSLLLGNSRGVPTAWALILSI